MGGSSSQRCMDPAISPINAFLVDELYSPQFLDSFQENTGYWKEPNTHESPVEQVANSPPKTKKPIRAHQKRMIQSDDAPRQIAWTTEEEIALAKCWVFVFENNKYGNAMKEHGFWCEGMIHYQVETENIFKYRHCWEVLKNSLKWKEQELIKFATESKVDSKRHKSSGSSSFSTESGDASINLNTNAGDNDGDEVDGNRDDSSGERRMLSIYRDPKKGESKFFTSKSKASCANYSDICYDKHKLKSPKRRILSPPEAKIYLVSHYEEKRVQTECDDGMDTCCKRGVRTVEKLKHEEDIERTHEEVNFPLEDLNKLADDFIARVNRQRRLEVEFCRS
nr:hypothetical protein CTI12_AA403130 [Tanacetum cinerariifolium]